LISDEKSRNSNKEYELKRQTMDV